MCTKVKKKMDKRKENTNKNLELTLANLLETCSFDDITTTQLAEAADISRSGFYTHYKDKYEMIDIYQNKLFSQLEYIFDKHNDNTKGAALEIFEFLYREPLFAALLSQNGTREIQEYIKNKFKRLLVKDINLGVSKDIQYRFEVRNLSESEMQYAITYLVNALFGVCQMWIERGKKESPEQVTNVIFKMMHN
ncbi:transcriptional regulator, TetR family [Streptococcus urinalis 2285-97]|uniref:Transcriptional regulator, TetR family n=2 Tax=Streptococcus urinalis TaxID=149016 RepID=G5KCB8_9STRE|nr:transcriptional regulator, TetR family [Streptococcus urinalis 2285-97]